MSNVFARTSTEYLVVISNGSQELFMHLPPEDSGGYSLMIVSAVTLLVAASVHTTTLDKREQSGRLLYGGRRISSV